MGFRLLIVVMNRQSETFAPPNKSLKPKMFGRGRNGWQPEMGFALSTACLQAVRWQMFQAAFDYCCAFT